MFLRNIFEAIQRTGQGKTAVIGWGRGMGHKGHMMLASSVITQAGKVGGDPYFVVSKTVGKDDPITPDEKIAIYKKVFPQSGHIFQPATDEIPDLTRVLQNLNQQGYTSVTVVLGADQVKAFQYLKNYNNKPDKSGNILYSFDNLDVISRQETGDPSAGEEGPRATPMRQVLMDPTKSEQEQFAIWRDAMSPEIGDDEVRDLMMKAKERMTAMNAPKPKKVKAAENLDRVAKDLTNPSGREAQKYANFDKARDQRRAKQEKSAQDARNSRQYSSSKDEWGDLKELSNEKLGQYKAAAGAQASAADKAGNTKKADKRFSGIVKATKKQFANDEKKVSEYGDTAKGQKMLAKVQKRAVDRVVSKKADTDPKYAKKNQDTANAAWDRMTDKDLEEKWSQKYKSSINCSNPKGFSQKAHCAGKNEGIAVEPDPKGYQKDLIPTPKNSLVIDTPGDLDWYKLGQHYPTLGTDDPHEYGQGDSDMMIVPYSEKELDGLKQKLDRLKMRYKEIGGGQDQPEIHDKVEEKMLPKSAFAGSDKNKLGSAAHLKGSMKRPARAGDLVGGAEESIENEAKQRLDPSCWKGYRKQGTKMKGDTRVNNCVKVNEDVENIMDSLINKIITNEAIQNNRR